MPASIYHLLNFVPLQISDVRWSELINSLCFACIYTHTPFIGSLCGTNPGSPGQRAVKRVCVCVCVVQDYPGQPVPER